MQKSSYKGSAAFGKTRTGPRRLQLRTPRGRPKIPHRTGSTYNTDVSEQISIAVPAIVSEELFSTVEQQLTENRQRGCGRKRKANHLLQGLLECKSCGYAYYGKNISRSGAKGKVRYGYYRCTGTDAYRFGGKRVCHNKQIRTDKLERAVWQDACELLRHPKLLRKEYERRLSSPETSSSVLSLKKQISTARHSVNRLIDAYTDGVLTREEFNSRIDQARKRLADTESQLANLQTETREQVALREALASLDDFSKTVSENIEDADWSTKREILRTLIARVVIEPTQVRIVYRINFPFFAKKASNAGKKKVLHFCCWSDRHVPRQLLISPDANRVGARCAGAVGSSRILR